METGWKGVEGLKGLCRMVLKCMATGSIELCTVGTVCLRGLFVALPLYEHVR